MVIGSVRHMRRVAAAPVAVAVLVALPAGAGAAADPPPCPPGTPSAERFAGLPPRVEYGHRELFRLARADRGQAVVGRIRVTMAGDGRTFFDGTTRNPRAVLWLGLDLGDGPATVTASFAQVDRTAEYALPCTMRIRRTVRGYRRFRLHGRCGPGSERVRPRSIIIACGDGNLQLRRLRWRGWNRSRATAAGVVMANDCVPSCAGGRFHFTPTRVRASRPRGGDGRPYVYTRLRYRHAGRWWTLRLRGGYWGA